MKLQNSPIDDCVRRSLRRAGFDYLDVKSIGSGMIRLSGCVVSHSDRSLAHAVTRTTAGVTSITNDLTVS